MPVFTPDRATGLARVARFVPHAGRQYEATRNDDLGPQNRSNVSVLSPYIRHRLVTETEVLKTVLAKHSFSAAEKFVQEMFWRTYFKGHLETRPFLWSRYCTARNQQISALETKGGIRKAYRNAVEANTGIDCFDAWVTELIETGYLHNHTRMWFASIWIFTLHLPWELGADFMYRHLLDGDPASNTLSWRWVGGLHTKGKTYLARPDNIKSCTHGRFSPTGLAREAPALDEPSMPSAKPCPPAASSAPQTRFGLLLTEEDLNPESLGLDSANVAALAGASLADGRSPLEISPLVADFTNAALCDGLVRASKTFEIPAIELASLSFVTVRDWAKSNDITTIVTAYAPVGPVADALEPITAKLAAIGVKLIQLRRAFDTSAWPYGTRGFFAMKEKIPILLEKFIERESAQSEFF